MAFPRLSASMLLASFILLLYWTTSSAGSHDPNSAVLSPPYRVKRDQPFETREKVKETFEVIKDTLSAFQEISDAKKWGDSAKDVLKKLTKFASVAPGCVGALFSVVNMVLAFIPQDDPVMKELKDGFAEVNRKLDSLSIQMSNLATDVEWFNYASVYSQDEVRILSAWRKFNEFRENSELVQSQDEKVQLAEVFTNYYEYTAAEASVANLYHYLTVSSTSLSGNLNELLKKKFKCDISEIGKYNIYFSTLLLKGMVLNEAYWKLIGLKPPNTEAKHIQMFKNVYKAQISAVEFCLNNYEQYMKEDVVEIAKANTPDNKQAIAVQVKEALDKKYNWYNWVVLVYDSEQHENYIILDLTKIPAGKVTVAVRYTLKAEEKLSEDLKGLADLCFKDGQCEQVSEKVPQCLGLWINLQLTDYVKVTHIAYGQEFAELPNPFHQVECHWGRSTSKISMYFSWSLSVCSDTTCENTGTCKRLLESNEALCECQDGYYGDRCEHRMDTSLAQEINTLYPVPNIPSTNSRLKVIESSLEKIVNTIDERCPKAE